MGLQDLTPSVKITIGNNASSDNAMFGPGIYALCKGVRETGSLNAAAKAMGMAYSKAWRIIKDTEKALGIQLLVRDGAHGSTLTEDCLKLLDAYDALTAEMQKASIKAYRAVISQ